MDLALDGTPEESTVGTDNPKESDLKLFSRPFTFNIIGLNPTWKPKWLWESDCRMTVHDNYK